MGPALYSLCGEALERELTRLLELPSLRYPFTLDSQETRSIFAFPPATFPLVIVVPGIGIG